MNRGLNFGAGPAMLSEDILLAAQSELLNWQSLGMSVMEVGHRTKEFIQLLENTKQLFKSLLHIPDNYQILFLGGAARLHFSMIPLNFLDEDRLGGYLVSGIWSELAFQEAKKLKNAYCLGSSEADGFITTPSIDYNLIEPKTSYIYFTPNETINGNRFKNPPKTNSIPLIADMTSCLLSEPINVSDYALIFAGAQKNIANAGLTVVIIRDDLASTIHDSKIPTYLDYRTHIEHDSLYATPPTFNCYLALKMLEWIKKQGGVEVLYQQNLKKSASLYQFIDASSFYNCKILPEHRSLMNVCFNLAKPELEELFLKQAAENGLFALKGHRTVGGLRASLYNSMPYQGVEALIKFMEKFAKQEK